MTTAIKFSDLGLPTTAEEVTAWVLSVDPGRRSLAYYKYMELNHAFGIDVIQFTLLEWTKFILSWKPDAVTLSERATDLIQVRCFGVLLDSYEAIDLLEIFLPKEIKFKRVFSD